MVEQVLAGIGLVACIGALAWSLLGAERRDALRGAARRGLRWRSHRKTAQVEAAKAIERARRPVIDRDGNVYRPRSFDRSTKDKNRR